MSPTSLVNNCGYDIFARIEVVSLQQIQVFEICLHLENGGIEFLNRSNRRYTFHLHMVIFTVN